MNRLLRFGLTATLALSACHARVEGNGVLGEEVRVVAPFDAVDVSLAIQATVAANAASQQVTLSGDQNLLQYVLTPVEGGVLSTRLHDASGIEPVLPLRLTVLATSLRAVRATAAAHVDVTGAGDPDPAFDLEVEAGGASHVSLRGPGGQHLSVSLSGGSVLDASGYPVAGATVQLGGGSVLLIRSAGDVAGAASGGSVVEVTGGGSCAALALSSGATCSAH